jgi:hypothetical protein
LQTLKIKRGRFGEKRRKVRTINNLGNLIRASISNKTNIFEN